MATERVRGKAVTRRPRCPSRRRLEEALLKIAENWKLSWFNAAAYKKLGLIEGCAHELSHALDLGHHFETLLKLMPDEESNKREASVLRIEVAALARLGVPLSMRRLWGYANWNGPDGVPSHAQLQEPLNPHEQSCTERFVALVINEIKHMRRQT